MKRLLALSAASAALLLSVAPGPSAAAARPAQRRRSHRGQRRDLRPRFEPPPPHRLDERRCGRVLIFPGLVRYDEVFASNAGIHHALLFTVGCTRRSYVWPARHQAGVADLDCPPMGARFRLRAGYDISGYSPRAQIVLRAMKLYGMIVADNGATGTSRARSIRVVRARLPRTLVSRRAPGSSRRSEAPPV